MARPEPPLREPDDYEGVAADMAAFGVCYIREPNTNDAFNTLLELEGRDPEFARAYAAESARIETIDSKGTEMTQSEVLLTVERRGDGQYYITFNGFEFILASPIQLDYDSRPECEYCLNHFRFSGIRAEETERYK